jgi:hypothetical protein
MRELLVFQPQAETGIFQKLTGIFKSLILPGTGSITAPAYDECRVEATSVDAKIVVRAKVNGASANISPINKNA